MLILIIAYLTLVQCASNKECIEDQHTNAYLSCKNDGRSLDTLFLADTFLSTDPCYPIDNTGYRKILTSMNIEQPSGFDVEHIIDVSNSIDGYLYIVGNMVLSNSSWNRGLGNFCWDNVKNEKSEVYGDIFDQAYHNVLECKRRGLSEESDSLIKVALLTTVFILSILLTGLLIYNIYRYTQEPKEIDEEAAVGLESIQDYDQVFD